MFSRKENIFRIHPLYFDQLSTSLSPHESTISGEDSFVLSRYSVLRTLLLRFFCGVAKVKGKLYSARQGNLRGKTTLHGNGVIKVKSLPAIPSAVLKSCGSFIPFFWANHLVLRYSS